MGRVVMFTLLFGGAYLLVSELWLGGPAARVDGSSVELATDDFDVRFSRGSPFSESYMVFGGYNKQLKNAFFHVSLAGLPVTSARSIHRSYPDFHMCKSPGAKQAQQLTRDMNFVAADASAKGALIDVVDLHEKRIGSGGERTCVTVSGSELSLESVRGRQVEEDVTSDIRRTLGNSKYYLAESAEVADCQSLLY
jgi:hypothetical protein